MDRGNPPPLPRALLHHQGGAAPGLGWPWSTAWCTRHSADIEIESVPGKGPRSASPSPSHGSSRSFPAGAGAPPRPGASASDRGTTTRSCSGAVRTLTVAGHFVTTADGGQAGITRFQDALGTREAFAVVITDLACPTWTAAQSRPAMKQASPTTPVIMLTGWANAWPTRPTCPRTWTGPQQAAQAAGAQCGAGPGVRGAVLSEGRGGSVAAPLGGRSLARRCRNRSVRLRLATGSR